MARFVVPLRQFTARGWFARHATGPAWFHPSLGYRAVRALDTGARSRVYFVLEIDIGDTTLGFGEIGGADFRNGVDYRPKLLSVGTISRGVSLRQNTLELPTVDVVLDDTDQSIAANIGASRSYYRKRVARIRLASPDVDPEDWMTLFQGIVSGVGQPSPLMWQFTITPNDLPLRRDTSLRLTIEKSDWPNALAGVLGTTVPILYGKLDSGGTTNTGAVPAYLVDSSTNSYLVCVGAAQYVGPVYVDEVAVAADDYTVSRPVVNGRRYTLIVFDSDQGAASVTCDARGYEENGDGTGDLIEDPLAVLRHYLDNFVYSDYTQGAWLSGVAPVDDDAFSSTFFSDRGYKASMYLDTKRKAIDTVNDFLASFEMKGFWNAMGELSVVVEDFSAFSYEPVNIIREDEILNISSSWPSADIVDEIRSEYAFNPADGAYSQNLRVVDRSVGENAPEDLDLPVSASFLV